MASEQWLLNDTSVANNAYFTAVTGGSYKLQNTFGSTRNRVTSSPTPYEGAGCYASGTGNEQGFALVSSAGADLSGATYYFDAYIYLPTGFTDFVFPLIAANDTTVEYSWLQPNPNTSLSYGSYDPLNGRLSSNTTATGKFSLDTWFRIQGKTNQYGQNEFRVFVGGNINTASPDTTVTSINFNTLLGYSTFEKMGGLGGNNGSLPVYLDSIKFDDTAYPTRSTAHTAAGTATGTATATASMSNARTLQASATGTATGTAAALNQRALAASATGTASGTAAMSSTQAMSASGSVTASGVAAADVTSLVTIDGAGTATASGTAAMSSTQAMSASATITATGTADASITPIITMAASGIVTVVGVGAMGQTQTLAATATATATGTASMLSIVAVAAAGTATASATAAALITTPGSLYGNATKVAGLYGSSTKPTLTTRS